MSKVQNTKKNFDRWILLASVLCFVCSVVPLVNQQVFYKVFFSYQLEGKKKVGSDSRYVNDVRRRLNEEVAWFPLRSPDDLFDGDTVFTSQFLNYLRSHNKLAMGNYNYTVRVDYVFLQSKMVAGQFNSF